MKNIYWQYILITIVLIPTLYLCFLIKVFTFAPIRAYVTNNQILSEYKQDLEKVSHPPDTSLIVSQSQVRRPSGNGNNCYYFVGEVRRFPGDRLAIKNFYKNQSVYVDFFDTQLDNQKYPDEIGKLPRWATSQINSGANFYLVYILETRIDDFNSFDLRCH